MQPISHTILTNSEIKLPTASGEAFLPVSVHHEIRCETIAFLDFDMALGCGAIEHRFEVDTESDAWRALDHYARQAVSEFSVPALPWRTGGPAEPLWNAVAIPVARLTIAEYPVQWLSQAGADWPEVLDTHEGSQAHGLIGQAATDILREAEDEGRLMLASGSAFVYRELHVHPRLRGQHLGLRLLAHALGTLPRSLGDFSILAASPIASIWARANQARPSATALAVDRLKHYYSKLGLREWAASTHNAANREGSPASKPAILYHLHEEMLPFLS